jgi:CBS-domain-containing membrane protein
VGIFHRFDTKTELGLAIMPTVLVIGVLVLLELFAKQRILFASLASSAFLIYLDPKHPTNSVRTLIIAQTAAAIIGYLVISIIGKGYFGAAVSMVIAIVVMILARAMHPPAVSTSLLFAFHDTKASTLMLFLLALLLLVLLLILQRMSLWLVRKGEAHTKGNIGDAIAETSKSVEE